tara:strand:- start:227 stop:448 length:222 start_codon:yes stop_codon:yes gene_type:complete
LPFLKHENDSANAQIGSYWQWAYQTGSFKHSLKNPNNQKKDVIKDIRGLLRNHWNNLDNTDLEILKQIKELLE